MAVSKGYLEQCAIFKDSSQQNSACPAFTINVNSKGPHILNNSAEDDSLNKIRKEMPEEIEVFIPVLRETYNFIEEYQLLRTEEREVKLRLQLVRATRMMQKFKPFLQRKWQIYLEALEDQERFPISDLIFALDCTIHQMHLRVGNTGLTREGVDVDGLTPWGKEMKLFLDERRRGNS